MAKRGTRHNTLTLAGLAGLIALALAPHRYSGWLGHLRAPLETVLAPIAGPVGVAANALRGTAVRTDPYADDSRAQLAETLARRERELLAALSRIEELEVLVTELQSGVSARGRPPTLIIEAAYAGASPPALVEYARGTRHGVRANATVAVARRSQQLVGVVNRAGPNVSAVHLVTQPGFSPGTLVGVALSPGDITAQALRDAPRLQLEPRGDGRLIDPRLAADAAARISVGDEVRLDDRAWPSAAQMFVLGTVTAINDTDDPLRFKRITVRPVLGDLARLRSVMLHTPATDDQPPTTGAAPLPETGRGTTGPASSGGAP